MSSMEQLKQNKEETKERQKPLRDFVKTYLESHVYLSARKLAKVYTDYNYTRGLGSAFGRILRDLEDLGIIKKYNSKQYKKVINPDNY